MAEVAPERPRHGHGRHEGAGWTQVGQGCPSSGHRGAEAGGLEGLLGWGVCGLKGRCRRTVDRSGSYWLADPGLGPLGASGGKGRLQTAGEEVRAGRGASPARGRTWCREHCGWAGMGDRDALQAPERRGVATGPDRGGHAAPRPEAWPAEAEGPPRRPERSTASHLKGLRPSPRGRGLFRLSSG